MSQVHVAMYKADGQVNHLISVSYSPLALLLKVGPLIHSKTLYDQPGKAVH